MEGRGEATVLGAMAAIVLVVLLAGTGAASTDTLRADAGSSQQSLGVDTTLPVEGEVFGGDEPYTFQWAIDGDASRFAAPTNRSTTVDLSGLEGTVNLTFTVTDADGDQASDSVLYHVATDVVGPVEETVVLGPGLPDEFVGASGVVDGQTRDVSFTVPADASGIVVTLSWQDDDPAVPLFGNDLDLVVLDPSGEEATGDEGRTTDHPEVTTLVGTEAGEWTARIEPWLSTVEDAHLEIRLLDAVQLPSPNVQGPQLFGVEDTADLHGDPGVENAASAWDLDADGEVDATGETAVMDDPAPGVHTIRYLATTEAGFEGIEVDEVEITDRAEHALQVRCDGIDPWDNEAMEFTWSLGTCWMHGGHHTYVFDETFDVVGATGRIVSVEQQFSPPTEYEDPPFTTPIHVQLSDDGREWTTVDSAEYTFVADPREGTISIPTRQIVFFDFEINATEASMFRVHQPRSSAQGLSGFVDGTRGFVLANETDAGSSAPDTQPDTLDLSCEEDILEDFFDEHPCWYGGINRYDAPSFFHTYHPGEGSTVTDVEATVKVGPWRTDDWFRPLALPVAIDLGETPPASFQEDEFDAQVDRAKHTRVFVQGSPDGQNWSTLGNETVTFGEPTSFGLRLDAPAKANFLRLVTEHHARSDEYNQAPPLHHPKAYFLHSDVTLTGEFPTS